MQYTGKLLNYFNQSELLEKLKPDYEETEEGAIIYKHIKNGICYMLSIEWLLRLINNPSDALRPEKVYSSDFNDIGTLAYYKEIANNQYTYLSDFYKGTRNETEHKSAEALDDKTIEGIDKRYTERCSNHTHKVTSTFEYTSPADVSFIGTERASYLAVNIQVIPDDSSISALVHETAVFINGSSSYFFDPNAGVYGFSDFSKLMCELAENYKALVEGSSNAYISISKLA